MSDRRVFDVADRPTPPDRHLQIGRGGEVPVSWGLGDGQAIPWEYASAPEARDIVDVKTRYGLFVGGKEIVGLDCDAPWVLVRPAPGGYSATATLIGGSGLSRTVNFTAPSSGQKEVTVTFPLPAGTPSVASADTAPVPANAAPKVLVPAQ